MLHRPNAVAPSLLAFLDRIVTVEKRATGLRTLVSRFCQADFRIWAKSNRILFAVRLALAEAPELASGRKDFKVQAMAVEQLHGLRIGLGSLDLSIIERLR
jgi:predicted nucleotidyltransferase